MDSNITLELDAALLCKIQALATAEGMPMKDWLVDRIEEVVRESGTYERARKRALARLREGLDLRWASGRARNELHER